MERKFVGAGLLSGLIAGIITFIYARIFIEPQVEKAIDYEEYRSHAEEKMNVALGGAPEHGHEHEVFTRTIQENVGAGIGTVIFALCMGAFFAVAFTFLWAYVGRRWASVDPRLVAGALGVLGWVAVIGVPFFVYPPNPPAVGDEDTIGARSGSYLTITAVSVVAMVLAVWVTFALWDRFGGLISGIFSGIGFLIVVTIAAALLPTFKEIPGPVEHDGTIFGAGFPGQVVADFRVYAIANQVILWSVLVLVFCLILGRMLRNPADTQERAAEPAGA
ncbi:CbtA family protein [Gordonia sp. (in: high G+C Gram-positive bacteria)]|uniref:CbtA family protein n=1 Tax=Gordonia sp. (in: high G+C Gram-positive bacteria) TaxID=84139 RepID=UPI00261A0F5A|nr:CbtA family protein [Gordonia sp. (in: high G+C Gram-positive bacteria)]